MDIWSYNQKYIKHGDFHIHTLYTDGRSLIKEYCQKAQENNLKLIAFTEHVRRDTTYNYNDLISDIFQARSEFTNLKILSGCEAKVMNGDGDLDVSEEVIDQSDLVIGVFHSYKYKDKKNYLKALEAMLKNPIINIWGHPTLFTEKHNIKLGKHEINDIVNLCVENSVLIERNLRYNLPDVNFIKLSINRGAKFIMGSDSHSVDELPTLNRLKEEWYWINKMY